MKKIMSVFGLLSIIFCSDITYSVPLINGAFDDAAGWNDASGSGSVAIGGGVASLTTGQGADPFSAVMVQGDDGFFNFSNPLSLPADTLSLMFDVRFDQVTAADESGFGFFTDSLTVSVYDAVDFTLDLLFAGDGFDFAVTSSWASVALDISSLAGRDVALSFELADEDDLFDTTVFLDNVRIRTSSPAPVGEPGILILLSAGLGGLTLLRKRQPYR